MRIRNSSSCAATPRSREPSLDAKTVLVLMLVGSLGDIDGREARGASEAGETEAFVPLAVAELCTWG